MEKGNISLKVTNVTKVHAGTYTCFVPKLDRESVKVPKSASERKRRRLSDPTMFLEFQDGNQESGMGGLS
ncbi:hypothetical protein L3Q82_003744 [Scortum barcoo]|uniref:Uncharacterized protein n=1 Tax=Scortum barcoo TaxID=214431 RepID=A0ACB8X734_9TELE|nr:hypothetical protein L3Q82_003744 [Scortum barcoo]